MIKASELRIGNLLYADWESGRIVSVLEVRETKVIVNDNDWSGLKHDELSPIPLTVEWLKKLSFEDIYDNGYDCTLRLDRFAFAVSIERRLLIIADPKASNQRAKGIGEIPIEHVHQLQNLVFAMSGEELTIKQPA